MVIRQATTLDIDNFYELFVEIMNEGYAGYSEALKTHFLTKDYTKINYYNWIEKFFRIIYLAIEGEKIVGFISGDYTYGGIGFVSWLGVKKEFRGKGIGKKLYLTYEDFANKKGAHLIELYTYPEVADFYIRLGFNKIGERKQGYFGQKNIIMNKKLRDWSDEYLATR